MEQMGIRKPVLHVLTFWKKERREEFSDLLSMSCVVVGYNQNTPESRHCSLKVFDVFLDFLIAQ